MKKSSIRSAVLASALVALNFFFAPCVQAEGQTREEIIALLTSGIWHFAGSNWSNDRVFEAKGTVLVRASNAKGVIKWKVDSKQISIIFDDHIDVMYLPLDPKGTKGSDQHGNDVLVTQVPGSASETPTGPASALSSLKPLTPAGSSAPVPVAQSPEAVAGLLTSKPWLFEGAGWAESRAFTLDGSMTIENTTRTAKWQVTGNKIIMTFKDHKDVLYLPLDSKGTKGMDEYNRLFIARQGVPAPANPGTSAGPATVSSGTNPATGASYFGTKDNHGVATPSPTPP